MKIMVILFLVIIAALLFVHLFPGLTFRQVPEGLCQGELAVDKPNWVSSLVAQSDSHYIAPLPPMPLQKLGPLLAKTIPNLTIVEIREDSLLGYRRSWWFHFVDWFCIKANGQVSSSATMGYSDLGKNRELIEEMRAQMKEPGN